ncbi:MAG: hypothetical protein OEZ33_05270 [Gammaproteobacteria bacterium]|nr:hypothetical protein [Gammaproteobacteria bacterium]
MSYQYPVNFDRDILLQYREELQWANQEIEMLAISLERSPEDMENVEKLRAIIQESQLSSTKLDLVPLSESLDDTLKGLDLLLDWQVFPAGMTDFVLLLIDRVMDIAREVEEHQFIDMRKTQAILVALQYIILAKDVAEITKGIADAVVAIRQEIPAEPEATTTDDDVLLFDDGIDLFGDDEAATESEPELEKEQQVKIDIFVPEQSLSPLMQARDFIHQHSDTVCHKLTEHLPKLAAE